MPKDYTISLNVGEFGLYGADCDGDEVNIYSQREGKYSKSNTIENTIMSTKTGRF